MERGGPAQKEAEGSPHLSDGREAQEEQDTGTCGWSRGVRAGREHLSAWSRAAGIMFIFMFNPQNHRMTRHHPPGGAENRSRPPRH